MGGGGGGGGARARFFEGLHENKIILGDLNCTVDKIDSDGEYKAQRLSRCCSNYAL